MNDTIVPNLSVENAEKELKNNDIHTAVQHNGEVVSCERFASSCEAVEIAHNFLDEMSPISAEQSYINSYEALDIANIEVEYKSELGYIFKEILRAAKEGFFKTRIEKEEMELSWISFEKSLKIKKYLESLGYRAYVLTNHKHKLPQVFIIEWENIH